MSLYRRFHCYPSLCMYCMERLTLRCPLFWSPYDSCCTLSAASEDSPKQSGTTNNSIQCNITCRRRYFKQHPFNQPTNKQTTKQTNNKHVDTSNKTFQTKTSRYFQTLFKTNKSTNNKHVVYVCRLYFNHFKIHNNKHSTNKNNETNKTNKQKTNKQTKNKQTIKKMTHIS